MQCVRHARLFPDVFSLPLPKTGPVFSLNLHKTTRIWALCFWDKPMSWSLCYCKAVALRCKDPTLMFLHDRALSLPYLNRSTPISLWPAGAANLRWWQSIQTLSARFKVVGVCSLFHPISWRVFCTLAVLLTRSRSCAQLLSHWFTPSPSPFEGVIVSPRYAPWG